VSGVVRCNVAAIDIREGEVLDAEAFKALIRAAIAENPRSSARKSMKWPA